MTELNAGIVFVAGLMSSISFSPGVLSFLGIVIGLTITTIKTRKRIFSIISIAMIGVVFVGSHFMFIVFTIGPILGSIIVNEDHVMKTVFFLGAISIPMGITMTGFWKTRKN